MKLGINSTKKKKKAELTQKHERKTQQNEESQRSKNNGWVQVMTGQGVGDECQHRGNRRCAYPDRAVDSPKE